MNDNPNLNPTQALVVDMAAALGHDESQFQWVSFDIPPAWLATGSNTVHITELHFTDGWLQNDLRVGVDTDSDVDRSWWCGNGVVSCNRPDLRDGELMMYIELCTVTDEFIRGDANMDGELTQADAIAVIDFLFNSAPLRCLDAADADDSGGSFPDLPDALRIIAAIYGTGIIPPPFPAPGPDPSDDGMDCEDPSIVPPEFDEEFFTDGDAPPGDLAIGEPDVELFFKMTTSQPVECVEVTYLVNCAYLENIRVDLEGTIVPPAFHETLFNFVTEIPDCSGDGLEELRLAATYVDPSGSRIPLDFVPDPQGDSTTRRYSAFSRM